MQWWTPMWEWDLVSQQIYGEGAVVLGRSIGLSVNPNALGLTATLLLLGIAALPNVPFRHLAAASAFITLLLSGSRGSILGGAAGLLILAALRLRRGGLRPMTLILPTAIVCAAIGALLAAGWSPDRILIVVQGFDSSRVDPNISGRFDLWRYALEYVGQHPFGGLGPPELAIGASIDSEWIRALVQGGPLLFAALLGGVASSLVYGAGGNGRSALALSSTASIALIGLSQGVMSLPSIVLFWLLLGVVSSGSFTGRRDVSRTSGGPLVSGPRRKTIDSR